MSQPIIAVVNDDSAFLHLMHQLLTDEGYEARIHTVGTTAYSMIRETMPDLVVLDIRMDEPESGWHVLDMMRLDPKTVSIPVIVCSADSLQLEDKKQHLEKHKAVSLEKPFDLYELLTVVERFVGPAPNSGSDSATE